MTEYIRPRDESKEQRGKKFFPFRTAAEYYRSIGWTGVIPVTRRGTKAPLAKGVTGHQGIDATDEELLALIREFPTANIGIRLPWNIIGIDVDAYDGRKGLETISGIERRLKYPLPETWRSTARMWGGDYYSGIYLFRARREDTQVWVTDLGPGSGVEIAQFHHRFATAPPSIHNSLGLQYQWWLGPGEANPPRPEQLPELPEAWNDYLLSPRAYVVRSSADLPEVAEWFSRTSGGGMCRFMKRAVELETEKLRVAKEYGGLHDTVVAAVTYICSNAAEGHRGLEVALNMLEFEFTGSGRRRNLRSEWKSAVSTAMAKAAAGPQEETDVCSVKNIDERWRKTS